MDNQTEVELQLQIFGSPGGKSRVSDRLVDCIVPHKIYVEPFIGGGAVYFKKAPAETEVINDKNPEIAFAYAFIKSVTPEQMARLKTFDWQPNKEKFFSLKNSEVPKDPVQRFYRFYYVLIYSYGLSSKTYGYFEKDKFHVERRVPQLQERMKNTKIYNADYIEVMKKYDSPETYFFLDPPYPDEWPGPEGPKLFTKEDTQKLHDYLKTVKGKFLMTINSLKWIVDLFSDFKLYKLSVPRSFKHGDEPKFELIVTNYDVPKKESNGENLAETYSGDTKGAAISSSGLQPVWIYKPKKKKEELTEKELNEDIELIKNVEEYDPSKIDNKVLSDDWRIVMGWYSTYKETNGEGIRYSNEDIINVAKLIYNEIVKRVKEDKMKHEFLPEEMTDNSKELFKIVHGDVTNKEKTTDLKELEPILKQFKDAIIIKDFVSLVGSQVKKQEEHKPNDYDVHVRMDKDKIAEYLERAIKVRLYKMVDEDLAEKLHVFFGDANGGHDTYVPMYDLVLVPSNRKVVDMAKEESKGEVKLMQPYEPQKPAGSAIYEIDKALEKLLKWRAN